MKVFFLFCNYGNKFFLFFFISLYFPKLFFLFFSRENFCNFVFLLFFYINFFYSLKIIDYGLAKDWETWANPPSIQLKKAKSNLLMKGLQITWPLRSTSKSIIFQSWCLQFWIESVRSRNRLNSDDRPSNDEFQTNPDNNSSKSSLLHKENSRLLSFNEYDSPQK